MLTLQHLSPISRVVLLLIVLLVFHLSFPFLTFFPERAFLLFQLNFPATIALFLSSRIVSSRRFLTVIFFGLSPLRPVLVVSVPSLSSASLLFRLFSSLPYRRCPPNRHCDAKVHSLVAHTPKIRSSSDTAIAVAAGVPLLEGLLSRLR